MSHKSLQVRTKVVAPQCSKVGVFSKKLVLHQMKRERKICCPYVPTYPPTHPPNHSSLFQTTFLPPPESHPPCGPKIEFLLCVYKLYVERSELFPERQEVLDQKKLPVETALSFNCLRSPAARQRPSRNWNPAPSRRGRR